MRRRLIAIQREVALSPYSETGERIDSEISPALNLYNFSARGVPCMTAP